MRYDSVFIGGLVVNPAGDPANLDIGIVDGRVASVAPSIDCTYARAAYDVTGKIVIPGVIDLHVHTSKRHAGYNAHRMMARAGVVTALEVGGPLDEFYEYCLSDGAGLNMACLQQVKPGLTVKDEAPDDTEITELLEKSIEKGALGLKVLGGHYPMTPESTRRIIEIANSQKAYIAFHAGTCRYGSNVEGLLEAIELSKGLRTHIPHINSYCSGQVKEPIEEILEALDALKKNRNIFGESYLAIINGTSARCINGVPESLVTQGCLTQVGYEPTQDGLRQAILDGYARIAKSWGGENINVAGEEGVSWWESANTVTSVNFPKNPAVSRLLSAITKDEEGEFVVDALATDGGAHPRNVAVERGMALVRMEAWTLSEFVRKVSYVPSRVLGLTNKGHISPGADGDLTVIDPSSGRAFMSMGSGRLIMANGTVVGTGTTIITTETGKPHVEKIGLKPYIVDVSKGSLYKDVPGDIPRPF
jgi:N-acyl-D-aspartate/D-glutamate deacylase